VTLPALCFCVIEFTPKYFGATCQRRGGILRYVDLPQTEGVNGVDDLLALKGADYVSALFDAATPVESHKTKPRNQSSVLVELIEDAELFHTSEGETYATIPIKGHVETWP
jgi:hypothetical protein